MTDLSVMTTPVESGLPPVPEGLIIPNVPTAAELARLERRIVEYDGILRYRHSLGSLPEKSVFERVANDGIAVSDLEVDLSGEATWVDHICLTNTPAVDRLIKTVYILGEEPFRVRTTTLTDRARAGQAAQVTYEQEVSPLNSQQFSELSGLVENGMSKLGFNKKSTVQLSGLSRILINYFCGI